ncbi:SpoIIE family protein phosphatase [Streptomyces sp. NPDC046915]|uniref:ATP-binding SpoIIE family protein phosphatase n=1 Tax=Streptomyces sp. NPDC046915 TaxID=3155257 RepID=UPI0033FA36E6
MGVSGALGSADPADPFDIESAAVVVTDADQQIVSWSPGAERLIGYPARDVVGQPVASVMADGNLAAAVSGLRRTDRGWTGVLAARHRAGHAVELSIRMCPLVGADGHHGWLVVACDVRDRLEYEFFDAVARGLLVRSPLGIAVLDTELRWKWGNRALAEMEGGRPDDAASPGTITGAGEPAFLGDRHARRALITGQPQVTLDHAPPRPAMARRTRERNFRLRSFFPVRDAEGETLGICLVALHATGQDTARDRLTLLNEASEHIGTTLDLERTVQELAEVVVPRVADFVAIDLLDEVRLDEGRTEAGRPGGPGHGDPTLHRAAHLSIQEDHPEVVVQIGAATRYPARSPQERCLATGKPILEVVSAATSWLVDDSQRWTKLLRLGVHTHLVVPLRARGITMGVVTLLRWKNPDPFDEDDLLLVEELVARAAVCVDNARRFARQHQAALTLQTSLLPPDLPRHNAVEVAYRYLPADTEAGVGGDWFDVIPLSGARVALVVGDVVGHGLHAAASMGRLRAAVQTLADLDLPPDELLTHVDDLVMRLSDEAEAAAQGPVVVGATCVYAVYDPVTRTIVVARAGHPSPAIAHLSEPVEFPDIPAGPPLGLGGLPFESAEITVEEGSIIALYTDGLIEASDRDVDVGMERLCFTLAHPDRPLEELCDIMVRTLLPERPRDDVAFLIARTHALSPDRVVSWDVPADPSAVHVARNNAARQLAQWGLDEVAFTTELIVSELVTNAIKHAYGPIRLRLIHERALICEVSDASHTSPHLRGARITDEGGRGLFLVAQVAQRWGTRHTSDGKTIWTEQQLPDGT